jgi:hypothetical protein
MFMRAFAVRFREANPYALSAHLVKAGAATAALIASGFITYYT